ncbi:MAG: hypothetical protein QM722_00805 [Piscinibacter sp.]
MIPTAGKPEAYDLARPLLGHVALGHGVHMCIGQMVARLEGEAVLKALAKRAATLEIAGETSRSLNNNLRSLKTLPLTVTAA